MRYLLFLQLFIFSIVTSQAETMFVAHKGAWSDHAYPQNTLEALKYALDNGYHGLEFDVMMSEDGVPFLAHDQGISRISSNCEGKVENTLAAKLETCIIHKNALWTVSQLALKSVTNPSKYSRMEQVLDAVLPDARTQFVWIDFKIQDIQKALPVVIQILNRYPQNQLDKILFNNGSEEFLRALKQVYPLLKTSFEKKLGAEAVKEPDFYFSQIGEVTDMIGVGVGLAFGHEPIWWLIGRRARLFKKLEGFMTRARSENVPVIFWTVRKDREIKRWMKLNPDYLLLDRATPPVL
jgi:glycerophosphoryl diester phosphodiesterase